MHLSFHISILALCAVLGILDISCFVVGAQMKLCNEKMFQSIHQLLHCETSSNGMKATAVYLINSLIHNNGDVECHDYVSVCLSVCMSACMCLLCVHLFLCVSTYVGVVKVW